MTLEKTREPGPVGLKRMYSTAGGQADSQSSPFRFSRLPRQASLLYKTRTHLEHVTEKSLTNLSGFAADDVSVGRLGVYN